jgi:hypothetical protein
MVEANIVEEQVRPVSTERLTDELFLELDNVKEIDENSGLIKRKYEERAKWLMHRISVYRPAPPFIVNLSDLTTRIKEELADLDDETLEYVLKESISRIFEGIDQRYFRLSVRRFLQSEIRNARKLEGKNIFDHIIYQIFDRIKRFEK